MYPEDRKQYIAAVISIAAVGLCATGLAIANPQPTTLPEKPVHSSQHSAKPTHSGKHKHLRDYYEERYGIIDVEDDGEWSDYDSDFEIAADEYHGFSKAGSMKEIIENLEDASYTEAKDEFVEADDNGEFSAHRLEDGAHRIKAYQKQHGGYHRSHDVQEAERIQR